MATKKSFLSLFSLLLFLLISQSVCEEYFSFVYEYGSSGPCPPCCLNLYKSTKNTSVTVIEVDKIVKALRDSGYEAMPTILERNLHSIIHPYCGDFLFFVDRQNRFTIYGNNTITLFVPPDEAIRFEKWIDLKYQIVMAKVDKEAFESGSLSKGSKLDASNTESKQRPIVDQVFDNETVSINNVKITKWNIYNDGHVIVHGTEDFFQLLPRRK